MNSDWDDVSFVISSQYRIAVLRRLADGPATPSRSASEISSNCSCPRTDGRVACTGSPRRAATSGRRSRPRTWCDRPVTVLPRSVGSHERVSPRHAGTARSAGQRYLDTAREPRVHGTEAVIRLRPVRSPRLCPPERAVPVFARASVSERTL
jgi:hypothetical protein